MSCFNVNVPVKTKNEKEHANLTFKVILSVDSEYTFLSNNVYSWKLKWKPTCFIL